MRSRRVNGRRTTIVALTGVLAILAVTGCASGSPPTTVAPVASRAAASQVAAAAFAGKTFELMAHDRSYSASHFDADAGEAFEIRFENRDSFKHAVYIVVGPERPKEYSETDLAAKSAFRGDYLVGPATTTYHVAALPPGTYAFFCPVHQAMVGTITVD